MTVAANWRGPHSTGMMTQANPATNVRHLGYGTLVGRPSTVSQFVNAPGTAWDNYARSGFHQAPGGNLRSIFAAADYFMTGPGGADRSEASVRMQLHNAHWMAYRIPNFAPEIVIYASPAATTTPGGLFATTTGAAIEDAMSATQLAQFNAAVAANRVAAFTARSVATGSARVFWAWIEVYSTTGAWLHMGRGEVDAAGDAGPATGAWPAAHNIYVELPIEYITRGGANDYPVEISFQENAGWAGAGGAARRTILTAVADYRFNLSVEGDVRSFHRYGTALVGGSTARYGIRIAEAVQGSFDQQDWQVELNIVTPGFHWANDSHLTFTASTRYDQGNHIGPVTIWNRDLSPDTGVNRDRNITFNMRLEGTGRPGGVTWEEFVRLVNDEVNFRGLYVGADSRARNGPVEVEVRLNRLINAPGAGAWTLSWQPMVRVPNTGTTANPIGAGLDANEVAIATATRDNITAAVGMTWLNVIVATGSTPGNRGATGILVTPVAPMAGQTLVGTFTADLWVGGAVGAWGVGANVMEETVTVANFGTVGLEFEVHEDYNVEDFVLRSGMQEWELYTVVQEGIIGTAGRPIGAVVPGSPDPRYHRTVRTVLRETVAGSMPGTGAAPITFEFNEGIEVLGVRLRTNDGHFSRPGENDQDGNPGFVWFGYQREANNFLAASINRNSVVIRPEIGMNIARRWRMAEINLEFYISIMPGFEHYFGTDEIEVTASASVDGHDWEETLTVAYALDPISVSITQIQLDATAEAEVGLMRNEALNDITITEVEAGMLYPGTRLWVGVEGGISRSWGRADHLSLGAGSVDVVGCDRMVVSPLRIDSHGVYVEILQPSRVDGAEIVFRNVAVSGAVFQDTTYNIFVAEDAVAANWDGFNWIRDGGWGVGFSRGAVRGFFDNEPYATPAFNFEGADAFLPPPPAPPAPAPVIRGPWRFGLNDSHVTADGDMVHAPVFTLIPNIQDPNFVTGYVAVRVIADVSGFAWGEHGTGWNAATQTATFSDGVNTVTFTHGSEYASVNGVPTQIVAGGLRADARVIGDRMFIPVTFLNQRLGHIFPINVTWNPYVTPADRSITITAR